MSSGPLFTPYLLPRTPVYQIEVKVYSLDSISLSLSFPSSFPSRTDTVPLHRTVGLGTGRDLPCRYPERALVSYVLRRRQVLRSPEDGGSPVPDCDSSEPPPLTEKGRWTGVQTGRNVAPPVAPRGLTPGTPTRRPLRPDGSVGPRSGPTEADQGPVVRHSGVSDAAVLVHARVPPVGGTVVHGVAPPGQEHDVETGSSRTHLTVDTHPSGPPALGAVGLDTDTEVHDLAPPGPRDGCGQGPPAPHLDEETDVPDGLGRDTHPPSRLVCPVVPTGVKERRLLGRT